MAFPLIRPRTVGAVVAGLALVLVGCSAGTTGTPSASPSASASSTAASSPSASPSPSASIKVSDNLDAITVKGDYLAKPTVTITTPYAVDKTRVKVLKEGTGTAVPADGIVDVYYSGSIGRTGKVFQESFSSKKTVAFPLGGVVAGFKKGLEGQKIGSRVLIAMPGTDGYDPQGGNSAAGIAVGDTLVFVVDIVSGSVAGPTGKAIAPANDLPKVTDTNGKPAIAIPTGNPPSTLTVQALTEGTGAKVKATDAIVVHYLGVSWKTGKVIEDVYDKQDSGVLADTISGWKKALVDKRIGQRVLMVLPPNEAYPKGSNNPPVEAGDTLVYVVDILFASPAN